MCSPLLDAWPRSLAPSSLDDEWDSPSTLASWTLTGWTDGGDVDPYAQILAGTVGRVSIGDGGNGFRPGFFSAQVPATAVTFYLTKAFVPPADFSIWSRILPARNSTIGGAQGTNMVGFFADAAGSPSQLNSIVVGYNPTGGPAMRFFRFNAGVPTLVGSSPNTVTYEYVGLQKVGTNFFGWAIDSEGSVVSLGTTAFATATAHAGYLFIDSAPLPVGNTLLQSGFVRGYASANFWPLNHWGRELPI